jgi:hypothetical protein
MMEWKLPDRFWRHVKVKGACWLWTGPARRGYGAFYQDKHVRTAHRVSYEALVGPVPDGLELDHICRNRACVRPKHLRAVDHRTNLLAGPSTRSAINAAKTACPKGHPYTLPQPGQRQQRVCLECQRQRSRNRARAKRQAKWAARWATVASPVASLGET